MAAHDKHPNSEFISGPSVCKFMVDKKAYFKGYRKPKEGLFKVAMKAKISHMSEINALEEKDLLQLYHERMGHQDRRHIRNLIKRELNIETHLDNRNCIGCINGKMHRQKFGKRPNSTKQGELLYADVCGPFQVLSISGYKYFVCLKDDFKIWDLYIILKKNQK